MQGNLLGILSLGFLAPTWAHAPVPEVPETFLAEARLFVLDNRPRESRLLALDLPEGKEVAHLSLPPRGMSLAATPSGRFLLVSRGRDTDRQWLTVVWTGKKDRFRGREEGGMPLTRVEALWKDLGRSWAASPGRVSLGERPTRPPLR